MTLRSWRLTFWVALAVQFLALYWPRTPGIDTGLPLDKLVHIVLFATVAMLGVLAGLPLGWLVLGLVAQAAISELVQSLLPARGADLMDFLADLLGVAFGLGVGVLLRSRFRDRAPQDVPGGH